MDGARSIWIDNARAVACVMVIALHAAAPFLYQIDSISSSEWMFANIIDSFSRACVPIFFMISGYFFLANAAPTKKHFIRIASALVFYSVVALAYRWAIGHDLGLKNLIMIAVSPAFYHLWFFYAIITVYLLMSVVRLREGGAWTMATIIAAMLVLNPSIFEFPALLGRAFDVPSPGFLDGNIVYYLGYACIGACFRQVRLNPRIPYLGLFLLSLYFASSLGIAAATFSKSADVSSFVGTFYEYSSSLVILQSISLFGAIHQSRSVWPLSQVVSALSLPIYGLHAIILDAQFGLGILNSDVSAIVAIPVSFLATLLISTMFAFAIRRVDRKNLVH